MVAFIVSMAASNNTPAASPPKSPQPLLLLLSSLLLNVSTASVLCKQNLNPFLRKTSSDASEVPVILLTWKCKFTEMRSHTPAHGRLAFSPLPPHHYSSLPPPHGAGITVIVSRLDKTHLSTIFITARYCWASPKERIHFHHILYITKCPSLKVRVEGPQCME